MPHKKKASDQQILNAYNQTGNIWKAAKLLGMGGQTVHERLQRMGVKLKLPKITNDEKVRIKEVYESGIKKGDGKLDILAKELGRTKQLISRTAGKMGLTSYHHKSTDDLAKQQGERVRQHIQKNGHPRGYLGHKHSAETRKKLSKASKRGWDNMTEEKLNDIKKKAAQTRIDNAKKGGLIKSDKRKTWKAQWQTIGGKKYYFRSQWEVDHAKYLEFLKQHKKIKEWEYEAQLFWFEGIKRGTRSYLPDFRVTENDGTVVFHEVKGWMDDKSKTKLKRMKKYHPDVTVYLIQAPQIKEIREKFSFLFK